MKSGTLVVTGFLYPLTFFFHSKLSMLVFWVLTPRRQTPEDQHRHLHRTTRRNNPEDSNLYTRRRENLKSHISSRVCNIQALNEAEGRRFQIGHYTHAVDRYLTHRDTPIVLRGSVNIPTEMFSLHWAELQKITAVLKWRTFVSELWLQCWTRQGEILEFLVDSVSGTRSGSIEVKGTLIWCLL
jgi:hypothetical protein